MESAHRSLSSEQPYEEARAPCSTGTPTHPDGRRHSTSVRHEEIFNRSHRGNRQSIVVKAPALNAHEPAGVPRTLIFGSGSMAREPGTHSISRRRNTFSHIFASSIDRADLGGR